MTESEPDVTPEQEAQLRRLLREARHDAPVPDDVAARLDEVLARLGTDGGPRVDPPQEASVVDLSARRRRTAARLLVAAAAVVVAGTGIGVLVHHRSDEPSGTVASSLARRDQVSSVSPRAAAPKAPANGSSGGVYGTQGAPLTGTGTSSAPNGSADVPGPSATSTTLTTIRPATFAAQARALRDRLHERAPGRNGPADDSLARAAARPPTCRLPRAGRGVRLLVTYQGRPAALVVRPPAGGSQVVDLLACGSGATLRSVTLGAPSH